MRVLITLCLFLCISCAYASIYKCPGGRIEYRNGAKFCCYDKEETTCTKIISPCPLLKDEDAPRPYADELLEDAAAMKCPPGHIIVGDKCCTKSKPPHCVDPIKNEELDDEDRRYRYGRWGGGRWGGGRWGRWGNRYWPSWRYGHRYWDENNDEIADEIADEDRKAKRPLSVRPMTQKPADW